MNENCEQVERLTMARMVPRMMTSEIEHVSGNVGAWNEIGKSAPLQCMYRKFLREERNI